MQALTHLFGSTDGYRTLARATGVSDAEDAALAALGFGSPRSAEEFEALATSPCMAGRLLPSGRYAITRLFPGPTDVAGRRTVERRTLVLSNQAWLQLANCDLFGTLLDERNWEREAFASGSSIRLETAEPEELLSVANETDQRTFDALLSAHEVGRCAALPLQDRFNRSILRLPFLMPPEQAMALGWGIGLWAVPSGVWVATLRAPSNGRNSFVAATAGAWRHPDQIATLLGSRARGMAPSRPTPRKRSSSNWVRPALIALGVLTTLVLLLIGLQVLPSSSHTGAPANTMPAATTAPEAIRPPTPPPASSTTTPASGPSSSAPAVPTGVNPNPPAFTGASGADPAFGSGTQANEPTPVAPASPAAKGSAPAAPAAPGPTSTPPTPPSPGGAGIPDAPQQGSTAWDRQVELLRQSIDLRLRLRGMDAKATLPGDWLREARDVLALANDVNLEARKLEDTLRALSGPQGHRLVSLDTDAKRQPGIAEDLASKKASDATLGADTLRQMALLMARMELSVSAQALIALTTQNALLRADAMIAKARASGDLERLEGWPSTPFSNWFAANAATRRTPLASFLPLVAHLLGSVVDPGEAGALLEQLKREEQSTSGGSTTP